MIKEEQKLNESKLAYLVFENLLDGLKNTSMSINDRFKYNKVIIKENLIESFSFDTFITLLNEKRVGKYEIREGTPFGILLMADFDKIE